MNGAVTLCENVLLVLQNEASRHEARRMPNVRTRDHATRALPRNCDLRDGGGFLSIVRCDTPKVPEFHASGHGGQWNRLAIPACELLVAPWPDKAGSSGPSPGPSLRGASGIAPPSRCGGVPSARLPGGLSARGGVEHGAEKKGGRGWRSGSSRTVYVVVPPGDPADLRAVRAPLAALPAGATRNKVVATGPCPFALPCLPPGQREAAGWRVRSLPSQGPGHGRSKRSRRGCVTAAPRALIAWSGRRRRAYSSSCPGFGSCPTHAQNRSVRVPAVFGRPPGRAMCAAMGKEPNPDRRCCRGRRRHRGAIGICGRRPRRASAAGPAAASRARSRAGFRRWGGGQATPDGACRCGLALVQMRDGSLQMAAPDSGSGLRFRFRFSVPVPEK
jgi:hypothetical protein